MCRLRIVRYRRVRPLFDCICTEIFLRSGRIILSSLKKSRERDEGCYAHSFLPVSIQMNTSPFFPRSRGRPRINDQRVISGIIYILKVYLQGIRNDLKERSRTLLYSSPAIYKKPEYYDRKCYWQCHQIEHISARLTDRYRLIMRYTRCFHIVIFYLNAS